LLLNGDLDRDVTILGVERIELTGNKGPDRLSAAGGGEAGSPSLTPVTVDGGIGKDKLTGGAGIDILRGGPQNDFIDARDGVADELVAGDAGNDTARVDSTDLAVTGVERFL
jgi:Ca2+-binding RTX toxin-like protein